MLECNTPGFSRITQLEKHFQESHADLDGKVVCLPSVLLRPLAQPFFPSTEMDPPPLPTKMHLGAALIPPPVLVGIKKFKIEPSYSTTKYGYFGPDSPSKSKSIESSAEYGILETFIKEEAYSREQMVFAEPRVEFHRDLSRPQAMCNPLTIVNGEPPMSILYEAFAKRMYSLERHGGSFPGELVDA